MRTSFLQQAIDFFVQFPPLLLSPDQSDPAWASEIIAEFGRYGVSCVQSQCSSNVPPPYLGESSYVYSLLGAQTQEVGLSPRDMYTLVHQLHCGEVGGVSLAMPRASFDALGLDDPDQAYTSYNETVVKLYHQISLWMGLRHPSRRVTILDDLDQIDARNNWQQGRPFILHEREPKFVLGAPMVWSMYALYSSLFTDSPYNRFLFCPDDETYDLQRGHSSTRWVIDPTLDIAHDSASDLVATMICLKEKELGDGDGY